MNKVETIELTSWKEFPSKIENIIKDYGKHESFGHEYRNTILFRGHSNSEWELKTTLERFSNKTWTLREYANLLCTCSNKIQSFTGQKWEIPERNIWEQEIDDKFSELFSIHIPFYAFWVYTRHHGFPSPLLDWTCSPYVALFFAFAEQQNNANTSSVYAYIERPGGKKGQVGSKPAIYPQGPYVTTHKRHFLQQCWYTVAALPTAHDKDYQFACHENIFNGEKDPILEQNQDILIKINIPRGDRLEVLDYLERLNINSLSLMQSEESLMQSLAFSEIEKRHYFVKKAVKE